MNRKQRFSIYMTTNFSVLGWEHALLWGFVLGTAVGFLIAVLIWV